MPRRWSTCWSGLPFPLPFMNAYAHKSSMPLPTSTPKCSRRSADSTGQDISRIGKPRRASIDSLEHQSTDTSSLSCSRERGGYGTTCGWSTRCTSSSPISSTYQSSRQTRGWPPPRPRLSSSPRTIDRSLMRGVKRLRATTRTVPGGAAARRRWRAAKRPTIRRRRRRSRRGDGSLRRPWARARANGPRVRRRSHHSSTR